MKSQEEQYRLWYETVVEPKLKKLAELNEGILDLDSFDHKVFFKEFLADLELLSLDNLVIETKIEKICAAIQVIKQNKTISSEEFSLRDLALIASLNNPVDRLLFFKKWKKYTDFIKIHGRIDDESLVNAYRLSALIKNLSEDVQRGAAAVIEESKNKVS
ncbi:MAG: hypothetical protein ACXVCP_20220 [Bdellovibrio sp.]